jgi:hypothetical protein
MKWIIILNAIIFSTVSCFQTALSPVAHRNKLKQQAQVIVPLFLSTNSEESSYQRDRNHFSKFFSMIKPFGFNVIILTAGSMGLNIVPQQRQYAYAATPLPKSATMPDAEKTAMRTIQLEMERKQKLESEDYNKRARKIEAEQGPKAREAFEREYRQAKEQKDQELMQELEDLQRKLLDQGIDPFNDLEGYRQCFLVKTGKDLAEVEGTDQYADAQIQKMGLTKQSYAFQKSANRQIILMIVQDYKNRGIDPLPEFANKDNHPKHANILFLTKPAATRKLATMQQNMDLYGQIEAPKPGELSFKEKLEKDPDLAIRNEQFIQSLVTRGNVDTQPKDDPIAAKLAEKEKSEEEKAKRKADAKKAKDEERAAKAKANEEARTAKLAAQEEKRIAKENAKRESDAAKAAAVATASATAAAVAATVSAQIASEVNVALSNQGITTMTQVETPSEEALISDSVSLEDFEDDSKFADETGPIIVESINTPKTGLPVAKVGGVIAIAVGAKFVMDRRSIPSAIDEAERQRQFNLLMGITDDTNLDSTESDTSKSFDKKAAIDVDSVTSQTPKKPEVSPSAPVTPQIDKPVSPQPDVDASKKRTIGIKSIFNKKKNSRETNLNLLLSPSATAPELAMILSKLLTFGAPGRFPMVTALAGPMPLETFDLDKAKDILEKSFEQAGITREEGAEIFANVVNCMLIDIIDLASSSLGKEASITYDALNVVINFMNHAASLYDAVAEGVEITPVTYGGNLPKSNLEQMYGAYAFSAMLKMDDDMTDRIELLRSVFSISEKKAEGIIMNASQKQMMEMMKTEEGQKQMEAMMSNMMGGMEGMEGFGEMAGLLGGGGEGEPNPEQLKQMLTMLKTMKDSGSIPREELATVREQFRESFGSSIDDILKQSEVAGGEMSANDRELLDLMKSILED